MSSSEPGRSPRLSAVDGSSARTWTMSTNKHGVVVIGLGNPLMGDDGLGIAVLERLRTEYVLPAEVELVEGGTWGLNLLPVIEVAESLILIDAIDTGVAPGTPARVERALLPRYLATKIS